MEESSEAQEGFVVGASLNPREVEQCQHLYYGCDGLSMEKIKVVFNQMGIEEPDEGEISRLFHHTNSRYLDLDTFVEFIRRLKNRHLQRVLATDADMVDAFVAMGGEKDRSGHVNASFLRDVVKLFELTIDIERLIVELDADGSGFLDFDEFCVLLRSSSSNSNRRSSNSRRDSVLSMAGMDGLVEDSLALSAPPPQQQQQQQHRQLSFSLPRAGGGGGGPSDPISSSSNNSLLRITPSTAAGHSPRSLLLLQQPLFHGLGSLSTERDASSPLRRPSRASVSFVSHSARGNTTTAASFHQRPLPPPHAAAAAHILDKKLSFSAAIVASLGKRCTLTSTTVILPPLGYHRAGLPFSGLNASSPQYHSSHYPPSSVLAHQNSLKERRRYADLLKR